MLGICKIFQEEEEFLRTVVDIDSRTNNLFENFQVQKIFAKQLENLGLHISWIPSSLNPSQKVMRASLNNGSKKNISFIVHSDTVLSPKDVPYNDDGQFIYGSGIADTKGGILVILKVLKNLLQTNLKLNFNINIYCSPNEEMGSPGFLEYFSSEGQKSFLNLGFEPALQNASIINSRNGNRWYQILIQGISAHSGRFGEDFLNAAYEAGHFMTFLEGLNDDSSQMRAHVGSIEGGDGKFNRICGQIKIKLDTRFPNLQNREEIHQKILQYMNSPKLSSSLSHKKARMFFSIEDDCPPMNSNSKNPFTILLLNEISKLEEKNICAEHSGGAADINYFSHLNNFSIDGLGPVGSGLHTRDEKILSSSLITRPQAIRNFLLKINSILENQKEAYEYLSANP